MGNPRVSKNSHPAKQDEGAARSKSAKTKEKKTLTKERGGGGRRKKKIASRRSRALFLSNLKAVRTFCHPAGDDKGSSNHFGEGAVSSER